jgi:hypothetical protein
VDRHIPVITVQETVEFSSACLSYRESTFTNLDQPMVESVSARPHARVCTHARMHAFARNYMHTCRHARVCTPARMHAYTRKYMHTRRHARTRLHARTHARMHTYASKYVHAYARTHMTHARVQIEKLKAIKVALTLRKLGIDHVKGTIVGNDLVRASHMQQATHGRRRARCNAQRTACNVRRCIVARRAPSCCAPPLRCSAQTNKQSPTQRPTRCAASPEGSGSA